LIEQAFPTTLAQPNNQKVNEKAKENIPKPSLKGLLQGKLFDEEDELSELSGKMDNYEDLSDKQE
jgi:hypothetical protein